jgi:hypothetical protein
VLLHVMHGVPVADFCVPHFTSSVSAMQHRGAVAEFSETLVTPEVATRGSPDRDARPDADGGHVLHGVADATTTSHATFPYADASPPKHDDDDDHGDDHPSAERGRARAHAVASPLLRHVHPNVLHGAVDARVSTNDPRPRMDGAEVGAIDVLQDDAGGVEEYAQAHADDDGPNAPTPSGEEPARGALSSLPLPLLCAGKNAQRTRSMDDVVQFLTLLREFARGGASFSSGASAASRSNPAVVVLRALAENEVLCADV